MKWSQGWDGTGFKSAIFKLFGHINYIFTYIIKETLKENIILYFSNDHIWKNMPVLLLHLQKLWLEKKKKLQTNKNFCLVSAWDGLIGSLLLIKLMRMRLYWILTSNISIHYCKALTGKSLLCVLLKWSYLYACFTAVFTNANKPFTESENINN